jgi:hypothetical protein
MLFFIHTKLLLRFLFMDFTIRYFLHGERFKPESNKTYYTSRHLLTALSGEKGVFVTESKY